MSFDAHANLAITTVQTAPSPALSGLSLVVAAGTGSRFAAAPFNATVWPVNTIPTPANAEILRVTGVATDTLTIVRATSTEPTAIGPIAIEPGYQIANSVSAKVLVDLQTQILLGALNPTAVLTGAYTALVNDLAKFNTTASSIAQPLPHAPPDKSLYAAKIVTSTTPANTVVLDCQGADVINVAGGGTTYTLRVVDQSVLLQYQAAGAIWNVLSDDLPLGQLDLRYDALGSAAAVGSALVAFEETAGASSGLGTLDSSGHQTIGQVPPSVVSSSQWVDMCRTYGCVPGTDITTALQTAINAANTANQDTTLYFSKPGVYPLNGTPQTGTALTYAYNGQILFPARSTSLYPIMIRIQGCSPIVFTNGGTSEPVPAGGVVIQTNLASAAWMFDAIPANNIGGTSNFVYTTITVDFQDIVLRAAAVNPPNGAVNGTALSNLRFINSALIDVPTYFTMTSTPTGTLPAVIFPPYDNQGFVGQFGSMTIYGYGIGIRHSEHCIIENLLIQACTVGVVPASKALGHAAQYRRILFQGVPIPIQPAGPAGVVLDGFIDIGDNAGEAAAFNITSVVNDPSAYMLGSLKVHSWLEPGPVGFPVIGAVNLKLIPAESRPIEWPHDNFQRLQNGVSYPFATSAGLGAMDNTHHVWQSNQGGATFTTATSGVKQNGSNVMNQFVTSALGRSQASRVISLVVTLGTSGYNVSLTTGKVIAGTNINNNLITTFTGGLVTMYYETAAGANTVIATSSAGVIAASTLYTLQIVVSNPIGGPYALTAYVNGVSVATGSLTTGQVTAMVDTDLLNTKDGFGFFNDTGSVVTSFAIGPD